MMKTKLQIKNKFPTEFGKVFRGIIRMAGILICCLLVYPGIAQQTKEPPAEGSPTEGATLHLANSGEINWSDDAQAGNEDKQEFLLKQVIQDLEQRYNKNIGYEPKILKGKSIALDQKTYEESGLEKLLGQILKSNGLGFEKVGQDSYVVFMEKKKKGGIKRLEPRKPRTGEDKGENESSSSLFRYNKLLSLESKGSALIRGLRQDLQISGTVTSEQGDPLPGVNVIVQGTSEGTVTDANGEYSLQAPEDGTLVFTFVGFRTEEIPVNGRSTINLTMEEEISELDEVVVVGYGTQKKSHLTASVSEIDGSNFQNRPISSIADGLQGTVPGLNVRTTSGAPEATPDLNIRGFTGFGESQQPLILVDGVERNISSVNPNDVESISVLKDGAATAIYGSRAPHGIILIKTKSGAKGKDMEIDYSSNFRYGKPYGLPEQATSWEKARYINEALRNRPGGGGAPWISELQINRMIARDRGDYDNPVFDGIKDEYVPYGTYPISETEWGGHETAFGNTNMADDAMKDYASAQQHNLSVSGGGEQTSYYVGLGYDESTGIFVSSHFKNRYSILAKMDTEITDWLNFNLSTNYVKRDEKGPNFRGFGRNYGKIFETFARTQPWWPNKNPNGSWYRYAQLPNMTGESGYENLNNQKTIISGGFTLNPFDGFNVEAKYNWRNNHSNFSSTTKPVYQVLPNGERVLTQRSEFDEITKEYGNTDYYQIDIHGSYSKTLADLHNFNVLAGFQQEENVFNQLRGNATDFYSESVTALSTASANFKTSDIIRDWATRGYFGRFSYNYDERYFVEFNGRYDATSRFLMEDRWGFFPSVSGAWNVASENFWPLQGLVSQFKPRASWSVSGDQSVGLYPFHPSINVSRDQDLILAGEPSSVAFPPPLVNEQLTWAKPTIIDIGFDLQAFDNRLAINYDWYQRTIRDQLGPPPSVPKTIGADVPQQNNAVSETRGWEINVFWRDRAFTLMDKPFRYNVRLNMSDYIGYAVEYNTDGTGTIGGQWHPGEVFGQNYHFVSNGIMESTEDLYANPPQGGSWYYPGDVAEKDIDGDGAVNGGYTGTWYNRGDVVKNGFNYPRKSYGITLGAEWNNFDLSFRLDGVLQWTQYTGHMYAWGTSGSQWFAPYFKKHQELGYWSTNNQDGFYPRNTFSGKNRGTPNDQYALDLSHLRIRNLKLGYNLPDGLINGIGIKNLNFYASIENMGFIYNNAFIKYDPEILSASNGEGYPPHQVYSFGVNLTF